MIPVFLFIGVIVALWLKRALEGNDGKLQWVEFVSGWFLVLATACIIGYIKGATIPESVSLMCIAMAAGRIGLEALRILKPLKTHEPLNDHTVDSPERDNSNVDTSSEGERATDPGA